MTIKKPIKVTRKKIKGSVEQCLFNKGLTSNEGAKLLSLQVLVLQELGSDIKIINSSKAGEIIGLVGDKKDIDEAIKYLNQDV